MASLPVSWLSSFPNLERLVCDYLKLEMNPQVGREGTGPEFTNPSNTNSFQTTTAGPKFVQLALLKDLATAMSIYFL